MNTVFVPENNDSKQFSCDFRTLQHLGYCLDQAGIGPLEVAGLIGWPTTGFVTAYVPPQICGHGECVDMASALSFYMARTVGECPPEMADRLLDFIDFLWDCQGYSSHQSEETKPCDG